MYHLLGKKKEIEKTDVNFSTHVSRIIDYESCNYMRFLY